MTLIYFLVQHSWTIACDRLLKCDIQDVGGSTPLTMQHWSHFLTLTGVSLVSFGVSPSVASLCHMAFSDPQTNELLSLWSDIIRLSIQAHTTVTDWFFFFRWLQKVFHYVIRQVKKWNTGIWGVDVKRALVPFGISAVHFFYRRCCTVFFFFSFQHEAQT